jgi:hypothetical protein
MSEKEAALNNFKAKLRVFEEASINLLRAWEKMDQVDHVRGASFSTGYPFHKSFDELVLDIIGWRHVSEKPPGVLDWDPE